MRMISDAVVFSVEVSCFQELKTVNSSMKTFIILTRGKYVSTINTALCSVGLIVHLKPFNCELLYIPW